MLVNNRANYLNTTGVTVNKDDILAYYVWIPRYKYKIWSVDNNDKKGKEQEIEIVFENKSDSKTLGKLGLMYASDYGYAASDECTQTLYNYNNTTCTNNNWLFKSNNEWILPQNASDSGGVFYSGGGWGRVM